MDGSRGKSSAIAIRGAHVRTTTGVPRTQLERMLPVVRLEELREEEKDDRTTWASRSTGTCSTSWRGSGSESAAEPGRAADCAIADKTERGQRLGFAVSVLADENAGRFSAMM